MLNTANFPKSKESQVHYLLACPTHIILLSTLLKKFPRNMFYCAINLTGYKKPCIDHGSKIVQTMENKFVQAGQRTEQGACNFPDFSFSLFYIVLEDL